MYPRLNINLTKLKANLDTLCSMCREQNIGTAIVTKVFCADEKICELIEKSDADMFADSRIENLMAIKTDKPKLLLRLTMPSAVDKTVKYADISMQSELHTVKLLAEAAKRLGKKHKVILMIDLGDLREGIFCENTEKIFETAEFIVNDPWLELYGTGTNLTCYGGILPDSTNLGNLIAVSRRIEEKFGISLSVVSGGNSSTMTMLKRKEVPAGITNLRLGESFVLGNDTSTGLPMEELFTDAFSLEAEIVELQRKPSKPIGHSGPNAFGEYVEFEDKGEMLRGILAIGRQDVIAEGISPTDENIQVIGASSDHLLVDLTAARGYNVGDVLSFVPDYGALLRLCTSKYVQRIYTTM